MANKNTNLLYEGSPNYSYVVNPNTTIPSFQDQAPKIVDPKPITASSSGTSSPTQNVAADKDVKVATPDIVKAVNEKAYSEEKVMSALFEDMGIQEILSVTRNSAVNIVNGQNVLYQPIENMSTIYQKYNALNMLPLQSSETIFRNFSISLEDKIVDNGDGTGDNGESEYLENNNLVINITNLQEDERVEIETLSIENLFNDTIYGGEFNS
jgi:hypothetical protein